MDKVEELISKYGQDDQRTAQWYSKRGEMLTASEISKAVKDASPAQKHEIMMSKLSPKERNTGGPGVKALIWGTRLEPVAKHIYSTYIQPGVTIVDTTCVPHPVHSFLGASPDGVLVTEDKSDPRYGSLVEFKCPISRDFSDTSPVPIYYFHQMQLQLECTGMTQCDYIEMKFKEVNYTEWLESTAQYKSCYAVGENGSTIIYRDITDPRDIPTWRREMLPNFETEWWSMTYWVFEKHRSKIIEKDPLWLETNLESFREVWETIQKHRSEGTLPDHPKEKTILTI
uniref:YqaJ viral recombinase domain-containing protein n=1 Tax=viral metagenome TaxID=1070528 RepID=A0A6C0CHP0_9ZZZZ